MKTEKKREDIIYFSIFLLLMSAFLFNVLQSICVVNRINWIQFAKISGIYLLINCIFFVLRYMQLTQKIFTPFMIFYVLFILFSSGQLLLMGLGENPYDLSYFWKLNRYTDGVFIKSISFTIFSVIFFQIGFLLSKKNQNVRKKKIHIVQHMSLILPVKVLFILSIVSSVIVNLLIRMNTTSYADIYNQTYGGYYNLLLGISFFAVSTYLLIQFECNSQWRFLSSILMLSIIFLNFVMGKRGNAMIFCLPLFLVNLKIFSKLKSFKNITLLVFLGYCLITLFYTISIVRVEGGGIDVLLNQYVLDLLDFKSIKNVIIEMGSSIRPLIELVNYDSLVGIEYKNGLTYLYSIFIIMPSFLRFGFDTFAAKHGLINLTQVITNIANANYGLGGSLQMEAYYNFSKYGVLFFIILGFFVGKLLEKNYFINKKYSAYFQICVLSFILTFPRAPMQDTLKRIIYFCVIPFFFYYYISDRRIQEEN